MQLYQKSKIEDAVTMAKKALKPEFLQTKTAPGVAVFLLNVQYYQYLAAAEGADAEKKAKADMLTKVSNTAKSILKHWAGQRRGRRRADRAHAPGPGPGQHGRGRPDPERDQPQLERISHGPDGDGFRALGQVQDGQQADRGRAGQECREEKQERGNRQGPARQVRGRPSAGTGVRPEGGQLHGRRRLPFRRRRVPATVRDAQFFLAEMYREGNDYKQAAAIYKSLLDAMLKDPSKPFDDAALRIFDGAGQSFGLGAGR